MFTCGYSIMRAFEIQMKAAKGRDYCETTSCEDCGEFRVKNEDRQSLRSNHIVDQRMLVTDPLERAVVEIH